MAYRWSRSLTSFLFTLTAVTATILTVGVGSTSTTSHDDWPTVYAVSYHDVALDAAMLAMLEPAEVRIIDRQETPSIVASAAFDVDPAHFAKIKVREATDDYRRLRIDYG